MSLITINPDDPQVQQICAAAMEEAFPPSLSRNLRELVAAKGLDAVIADLRIYMQHESAEARLIAEAATRHYAKTLQPIN